MPLEILCYQSLFLFSEKQPTEATFHGSQYLMYDLKMRGDPVFSEKDKLTLSFKTTHASGLLFYTGEFFLTVQIYILYIYYKATTVYLHFRSNPLMNFKIFATIHSLMNDTNLIDSCHSHLSVRNAWNVELIRQK